MHGSHLDVIQASRHSGSARSSEFLLFLTPTASNFLFLNILALSIVGSNATSFDIYS